jgi:hypothetical protein
MFIGEPGVAEASSALVMLKVLDVATEKEDQRKSALVFPDS